jgi:hypothetical protein
MQMRTALCTITLPSAAGAAAGLLVARSADPTSALLLLLIATPLILPALYRRSWWAAPLFTAVAFGVFTIVAIQRVPKEATGGFFLIWFFSLISIAFSVLVSFCIASVRARSISS